MAKKNKDDKDNNNKSNANYGDFIQAGVEVAGGVASGIGAMLGYKDTKKSLKAQRAAMQRMKELNKKRISNNLGEHRETQERSETQHTISDLLEDGSLVMQQSVSGFVAGEGSFGDQIDTVNERQEFDLETRDKSAQAERFGLAQQYKDAQRALDQQIAAVNSQLKAAKSARNSAYISAAISGASAVAGAL